jgi:DNA-binding GntR family transcriptional regulator
MRENPGVTTDALAEASGMSRAIVRALLLQLAAQGLVDKGGGNRRLWRAKPPRPDWRSE